MQNALTNKTQTANAANVLIAPQKEVSQSPNTAQAMPQSLHQLHAHFRQLGNYQFTGAKGANNATDNVEVKTTVDGQQLLL